VSTMLFVRSSEAGKEGRVPVGEEGHGVFQQHLYRAVAITRDRDGRVSLLFRNAASR